MNWLRSPKVIAGVLVNGAYLLFCLLTTASDGSVMLPISSHYKKPATFVSLPAPTGPSKATFYKQFDGELAVYLTNELTLVNRHGHKLLLFPSFSAYGRESLPRTVLLSFMSYSREQTYPDDCSLVIKADDTVVEPIATSTAIKHYTTTTNDGLVSETMGRDISFDDFVKIITANRVVVSLGPDVFELTPEQVEPLRDMYRILQQYNSTGTPSPPSPTPASYKAQPSQSPRLLSDTSP